MTHALPQAGGTLQGGVVGSSDVTLMPGRLQAGTHTADTGTAGSTVLLAQSALPCLLFAAGGAPSSTLELKGGTDAAMAPPVDFLTSVLLPLLSRTICVDASATVARRGFYPKGGGVLSISATPLAPGEALKPLQLTSRGAVKALRGVAFAAGSIPVAVAQRMADAARDALLGGAEGSSLSADIVTITVTHEPPERAFGDGCGITLVAETDTGACLNTCWYLLCDADAPQLITRQDACLAPARWVSGANARRKLAPPRAKCWRRRCAAARAWMSTQQTNSSSSWHLPPASPGCWRRRR